MAVACHATRQHHGPSGLLAGAQTQPESITREFLSHSRRAQSYLSVRARLLRFVELFAAACALAHQPLCVCLTGHSAGGALATLAALDLACAAHMPRLRIAMYNFGSPRVGNKHFTTLFDQRVPNAFRVIYEAREAGPEYSRALRYSRSESSRTPATRTQGDIVTSQPKHARWSWIYLVCCCLFLGPIGYVWNPLLLRVYKHVGVPVYLLDNQCGDLLIAPGMIERNLYM